MSANIFRGHKPYRADMQHLQDENLRICGGSETLPFSMPANLSRQQGTSPRVVVAAAARTHRIRAAMGAAGPGLPGARASLLTDTPWPEEAAAVVLAGAILHPRAPSRSSVLCWFLWCESSRPTRICPQW